MHNLEHNRVLHERVVLLTVKTLQLPHVEPKDRVSIEPLSQEFYRFIINYGFMKDPDIPNALENLELRHGLVFEMSETAFFSRPRDGDRRQASRHDDLE